MLNLNYSPYGIFYGDVRAQTSRNGGSANLMTFMLMNVLAVWLICCIISAVRLIIERRAQGNNTHWRYVAITDRFIRYPTFYFFCTLVGLDVQLTRSKLSSFRSIALCFLNT